MWAFAKYYEPYKGGDGGDEQSDGMPGQGAAQTPPARPWFDIEISTVFYQLDRSRY